MLAPPAAASATTVEVVQTDAALGQELTRQADLRFWPARFGGMPVVRVNDRVRFQRVTAFGGTMTDSAAWLLEEQLPPDVRDAVMNALFGPRGIRLGFIRIPMGASDFTANQTPYSYDDMPPGSTDPTLAHFSTAHDDAYIIPALREAQALNPQLELMANPWSPPGWMKANDSLDNRNHTGTLLPSAYQPLAEYFVKFLQAYAAAGIHIEDISAQNEPGVATLYPGLQLGAAQEAALITKYLKPALAAARLDPRIYGHDLGFSPGRLGVGFARTLVSSRAARKLLTGLAWHCYHGSPYAMGIMHRRVPQLDMIGDECASGITPMPMPEEIISQLRDWARVVAFWSFALDPSGGPVQPPNHGCGGCVGMVTVDTTAHRATLGPTYFQLGQASAFIDRGARRISSGHFVSYTYRSGHGVAQVTAGIDDVALQNPDGGIVLLTYNTSATARPFAVRWHRREFTYTLPAGAMTTFVWR